MARVGVRPGEFPGGDNVAWRPTGKTQGRDRCCGRAALYYLPLAIAERLGYFNEEGLQIEVMDFAGGAKALQAMMGGSADVVSGGFDHVMVMRARGQNLKAFVLQGATPAISLGIAKDAPRSTSLRRT